VSRHAERLSRLRHALRQAGLDALLVAEPANVTYLSGFRGDSSWLLAGIDHTWLITDGRYTEQAAAEAPHCEIVRHTESLARSAADLAGGSGVKALGFAPAALSFAVHGELCEALDGRVEVVPRKGLVERLREVKDPEEIERIREAAHVADAAFVAIRSRLSPGSSEREVANALELEMRSLGARKGSFDAIVAARERSSLPHAQATDAVIAPGDAVLIDWGAELDLYCSDCTRVVFLTAPTERWREVYGVVRRAQQRAIETIRPGVELRQVDAAARELIAEAGYGENFSHGLGHGVGLRVHEAPTLNHRAEGQLAEGMVVTVEPGIYLPGWGGVRIEDLVVVREDGAQVLSSVAKDLDAAIMA
jgi:Xaa-Pro aminopeptidase